MAQRRLNGLRGKKEGAVTGRYGHQGGGKGLKLERGGGDVDGR